MKPERGTFLNGKEDVPRMKDMAQVTKARESAISRPELHQSEKPQGPQNPCNPNDLRLMLCFEAVRAQLPRWCASEPSVNRALASSWLCESPEAALKAFPDPLRALPSRARPDPSALSITPSSSSPGSRVHGGHRLWPNPSRPSDADMKIQSTLTIITSRKNQRFLGACDPGTSYATMSVHAAWRQIM